MLLNYDRRGSKPSMLASLGALLAAAAVGLSAYAAHSGLDDAAKSSVQTAAFYSFGHGLALAALQSMTGRQLGRVGLYLLLIGTLLFCGSLVAGAVFNLGGKLAPIGGISLMLGWVVWAVDALRRR